MRRSIKLSVVVCALFFVLFFALPAHAQTIVTGTFLTPSGATPVTANLKVLQQINGADVCGELQFTPYNAGTQKPWAILWNGVTYLPQTTVGYIRCSDGALINATGGVGISIVPNTDAQPQGTLTLMRGGLTGAADGSVKAASWSEAKAVPDQTSVSWGSLPTATIVDVGYQAIESNGTVLLGRQSLNFLLPCSDNPASTRTDCGVALTSYVQGQESSQLSANGANQIQVSPFWLPFAVTFGHITVEVGTPDSGSSYSWGIYSSSGAAICTTTAAGLAATNGADQAACSQGSITLLPGAYFFAFSGSATTGTIGYGSANSLTTLSSPTSSTAAASGQVPPSIAIPSSGQRTSGYAIPVFVLN